MCKNSGFRSIIQKSYKKFGIESKNLIIFSESIPNLLPPPCFLGLTQIAQISRFSLWVGNLTDASACGLARADSTLLLGSHGSHRSHSIALWVGNLTDGSACVDLCGLRWGHIALALTDLSFGPFGQIRPIGQIGRIGHF